MNIEVKTEDKKNMDPEVSSSGEQDKDSRDIAPEKKIESSQKEILRNNNQSGHAERENEPDRADSDKHNDHPASEKKFAQSNLQPRHNKFVAIKFYNDRNIHYYIDKHFSLKKGDSCIVKYKDSREFGTVIEDDIENKPKDEKINKTIIRRATKSDLEKNGKLRMEEIKALETCREKVTKRMLKMKLISSKYSFNKAKLTFYFTANRRVDFRELVKDLAYVFKTRIEMRQIGIRDALKLTEEIGICGKKVCCASFLDRFKAISIKMAKRQSLNLNPFKISGCCGRLLCCLEYEDKFYREQLVDFPEKDIEVEYDNQTVRVINFNVLKKTVTLQFEDNIIKEVKLDEIEIPAKSSKNQLKTKI